MASKDDNSGLGCLIIIGIVILCAIVRAVMKWSSENPGMMIKIGITIGVVIVCWIVWGVTKESRRLRNAFDRDYSKWLNSAGSSLDEAEKFANEDSKNVRELDNRITDLENAVRKIH